MPPPVPDESPPDESTVPSGPGPQGGAGSPAEHFPSLSGAPSLDLGVLPADSALSSGWLRGDPLYAEAAAHYGEAFMLPPTSSAGGAELGPLSNFLNAPAQAEGPSAEAAAGARPPTPGPASPATSATSGRRGTRARGSERARLRWTKEKKERFLVVFTEEANRGRWGRGARRTRGPWQHAMPRRTRSMASLLPPGP